MKMCINCQLMIDDQLNQCPHCGYVEGANPMDYCHLPPRTVLNNRYILGRPLGSGGFGVTYIAWDTVLEIRVAIKEYMPGELAKRTAGTQHVMVNQSTSSVFLQGKQSFIDESLRLARLGDIPGVVKIFDCFEDNFTAYIVMEFLEGETLLSRIQREGRMTCDNLIPIILPVLNALERIHQAGLMHRDIAPDNIMLCRDGRVVLIDFGAARHMTTRHSRSLSTVLKIGYAPAEQYYRDGDQGSWTDVYAVGATMYHALTGVIPCDAYTRANNDTLAKPSTYARIPHDIEVAILNAMNVTIEKRTRTAGEFAAQLAGEEKAKRIQDKIRQAKVTVSGKTKVLLGASIAAAAVVLVLILFFVPQLIVPRTQASVPDGMSRVPAIQTMHIEEAETALSDSDLRLRISDLIYDDYFQKDIVLYQNPGAGSVAYIGSMVDVTVSAPEETETVPDITGFESTAAAAELERLGFVVVTREEYNDTTAAGSVIYQSISPSERAKPGSVIELVISLGPENSNIDTSVEVPVPSLAGMSYEQAQTILLADNLYIRKSATEYSDTVPAGQIISQTPAADQTAHQGDTVSVVVSAGKETSVVPNLQYISEEAARNKLSSANLNISVYYEESLSVSAGLVIRQDVAPKTVLEPRSTVTVWVSTGYQVTVPSCVGKTQEEAVSALSAARLAYAVTPRSSDTVPAGQVISQSVAAGQSVEQGTTVTLVVSSGKSSVSVTGVSVTPARLTMNIGDTSTLVAAIKPANASTATVTWKSDNTAVAQVDAGGTVTARGAGTATVTVTTTDGGKTASCTVTVTKILTGITVTAPAKTVYYLGDSLNRSGLAVRAAYSDGSSADVTSKCTLSGFDSSGAGTKTVTVTYTEGGVTRNGSFSVVVSAPLLSSITMNSAPSKITYYVGDQLDTRGLSVTAHYTDGSTADVSGRCVFIGYDPASAGTQTITVSYAEGSISRSVSYKVTVTAVPLSSIAITSPPARTAYYIGDSPDYTGLVVTATYSNGSTAVVTGGCSISGFDSSTGGTQTITVTYTDGGVTKSASFNVTVHRVPFELRVSPDMQYFFVTDTFNTEGMTVYASYNDGTTAEVTDKCTFSGFDSTTAGIQTIYVSYTESGVSLQTTYQAEVTAPFVTLRTKELMLNPGEWDYVFYNYGPAYQDLIWESSDWNIATVGADGIVTAISPGNVTVTASVTHNGITYSDTCSVNVNKNADSSSFEYEVSNGSAVITKYTGSNEVVVVPSTIDGYPVKSIGDEAFRGSRKVKDVTVSQGITDIGERAFYDCIYLAKVRLPSGLNSIGLQAFSHCSGLTTIDIPNGVPYLRTAFDHCTSLVTISLPASIRDIGGSFTGCSSLIHIHVDEGNATYSSYAGELMSKDRKILHRVPTGISGNYLIPEGVTTVDDGAFFGNRKITAVHIPGSVTSMKNLEFLFCESLMSFSVDSWNSSYSADDGILFSKDGTCLLKYPRARSGSYVPPANVTSYEQGAFYSCEQMTSVTIPETQRIVRPNTFSYCDSLATIRIPANVTIVEGYAFRSCENLNSVAIPGNSTSIEKDAFVECKKLKTIYCNEGSEAYDFAIANGYSTAPYDQYPG